MNFTDFYPIYLNPKLGTFEIILHIPAIIIAPINIFFCSIFVALMVSDVNRFHINFCILRIQMLGAFYCISTGRLILSTIALINNSASNGSIIWKMGVIFLNSVGADLLRFLWITIFVERYFATIYSMEYEYEKKKFIFLPILLTLFTFTLTTMLAVCRHALNCNAYTIFAVTFLIDIITIVITYYLFKYNRRLRVLRLNSIITLTQRYQICENVRVLRLMFPIIVIGAIYTSSGTFLNLIMLLPALMSSYRYLSLTYNVVFNLYVLSAFIIWIRNDEVYRIKIQRIFKRFLRTRISDSSHQNELILMNVEGERVYTIQTMELHFTCLNDYWNNY